MWLFKHPSTRYWQAGWRTLDGTQRTRSTKTTDRKLAKQRAIAFEREDDTADRAPTQTLHAALVALAEHKRRARRSAATMEITACKSGHLLRIVGGKVLLGDITLKITEAYLDQRRTEGAHDHTIHKELGMLLQALRIARRHKLYLGEPKDLWPVELDGAYTPCDTFWTLEQYEAAMATMILSRRDHVGVYCHTGVRLSELYRPHAKDIDHAARRVWIDGTKTKASKRWIDLDDTAYRILCRRAEKHPTGPLFPDRWSRSRLVNDLKRVCKRAGVPEVSANDLRRTFATWCADADIDERTTLKWMGHTSSNMIRRIYQQLSAKRGRSQIERLSTFTAPSDGPSSQGTNKAHEGTRDAPKPR